MDKEEKPKGLYHQAQPYSKIRMKHQIIILHQIAFPELAEQMLANPNNAANIYACFLALVPLQVKGELTEDKKKMIMEYFKLL